MKNLFLILQIIVSACLIIVILLQAKGAGIGTVFGGSGGFYRSRRGVEKLFIFLTIFLAVLLFIVSITQVFL